MVGVAAGVVLLARVVDSGAVLEGTPVDIGPIVDIVESIWVHAFRLDVHATASNGGSAVFMLVMSRISVSNGIDVHQWDLELLVRTCNPCSLATHGIRQCMTRISPVGTVSDQLANIYRKLAPTLRSFTPLLEKLHQ